MKIHGVLGHRASTLDTMGRAALVGAGLGVLLFVQACTDDRRPYAEAKACAQEDIGCRTYEQAKAQVKRPTDVESRASQCERAKAFLGLAKVARHEPEKDEVAALGLEILDDRSAVACSGQIERGIRIVKPDKSKPLCFLDIKGGGLTGRRNIQFCLPAGK